MMATPTIPAAVVKANDTVSVDYVGTLENGTLFDTSLESEAKKAGLPLRSSYEPLAFKVGAGQMIPGFDAAVLGMKVGEEKTVTIPPAQAYGEPNPQDVVQVPLTQLQAGGIQTRVGVHVATRTGAEGVITAINAPNATVDFNHPLAGQTLTFRIILRGITPK